MKPIKLEMEHFGPFKNETIDFRSVEGQMFLISGKTGSGKTMIFDAITFGLYGQTSTKDRDEDSVRSQFATDEDVSRVSLEFKIGGQKYKVERELSFSKEGRKSKVPSKAALYAEDGTVLESSVTGVTNKIIEIIQLTAEQFRQILILPQGEFKRLLVSTSEEKQKILRTLFRTERFVHFELKLRDLERNVQTEMHHLEAKISEQLSTLPDSEEHPSFHHRLTFLEKKIEGARLESGGLEGRIRAARAKRNALQEELNNKTAHNEKVAKLQELTGQQERLENRSGSIRLMEGEIADYKRVSAISFELKREQELKTQLIKSEDKFEELNSDHDKIEEEYAALQEELSILGSNECKINESERFITRNERFLDDRFETLPKRIDWLNKELEQLRQSCRKLNDEYASLGEALETLTVSHEDFETLTSGKHALELEQQALKRALEQEGKYIGYDSEINAIKEKLRINENNRHECEQSLESVKSTVHSKFKKEDREHIEHLFSHLEVGGACPVCQKTVEEMPDAPYYMSEAEEEHISTLNARLEKLKDENESLRHEERMYVKLLQDAERLPYDKLAEELEVIKASVSEADGELKDIKNRLERKETIQTERDEKSNLLHKGNIEIEKTGNRIGQLEEHLKDFSRETGFDDYSEFKYHMEHSKKEAEAYRQHKESLEARRDALNQDLTMLSQSMRHLKEMMDGDKETISGLSAVVDDFLDKEPFIDRAELHQLLSMHDMEAKEQEVHDFHREKSSIETQIDAIKKELSHGESFDLKEDRAMVGQADDELERLQTELAVLHNDIRQFQRVFETVSTYIGDYETKKERYQAVHELFQKVTGNNHSKISLERYVLTYFLEKILNIANSRLLEMTNHRYALIRSRAASRRKTGLDIEVFDYYNNSARHISSLSGGETFQASLSLALALSEAVQQEAGGIHLDTMFIDEGFGTLDKETLEIAISTLIDLQSGGKTIGIISHVTELKEQLHHILEVKSEDEMSTATFNI
ncbi:AAA family ATPase [Lacicoccus alkaliphilus]|uniref:Nuclease SbcCD subunit C n=1 Tax=Lacicoccus alkaliphilus DSM 16010 TaxID=1123231 RepID=A0A1M7BXF1_9BACL|nr:SMC family ATPase [Salinicoccus alkaliphilus]SHL59536.1 exonuclease SbcC [Salinicoccus alkaliphilus DSM 16010]